MTRDDGRWTKSKGSPTFGEWTGVYLPGSNGQQLFIPEGFAHGFCVLSENATFSYKCSDFYSPKDEGGILGSDDDIGMEWPIANPLLSDKDAQYSRLKDIPPERLPRFDPEQTEAG